MNITSDICIKNWLNSKDEEIDDDDVDDVLVETVEEKTSDSSVPRTPIWYNFWLMQG